MKTSSLPGCRDRRPAGIVGREARLELEFTVRSGRTVVAHAYAEPPFRVGRAFDLDGGAYMILVSTGPGVFAGDRLRCRIEVGPGARAFLVSQSALQVHPSDTPADAVVQHAYQIGEDAELHCHWDAVVPFAGARLRQRFNVSAAPHSRVYWSDALMSGRASRGESWQFEHVDHELRFNVGDSLEYLERYCIAPGERPPERPWRAGRAEYLGTTIVRHEAATLEAAADLHRELGVIEGLEAAVDLVEPGLLVGRLMARAGTAFAAGRNTCRTTLLRDLFGDRGGELRR